MENGLNAEMLLACPFLVVMKSFIIYALYKFTANSKKIVLRKSQTLNSKRAKSGGYLPFRAFDWANNPSTLLVVHFKCLLSALP